MRALPSLIRMHRFQLDEHRRNVASLEALKTTLEADVRRLETELGREREAARGSLESLAILQNYIAEAKARRGRLENSISEVDVELEEARDAATEAFRELKKFEKALEAHQTRARLKRDRKANADQDEVALNIFRRKDGAAG